MKANLFSALFLSFSFAAAVAQTSPKPTPAAPPAPAQPAANASGSTTNKPDINELIKAAAFTNDTGMVLVKISPTFWAGVFEVTQKEYQKVMGSNPSEFNGDNNPVDSVSWTDARSFCAKLTDVEKKAEMLPEGFEYTLPTQAQWESLVAGADLKDAVISEKTSRTGTAPVGSLKPNSLGLYDTRGNVWELCLDPDDKPYRVLRGAAWNSWIDVNLRTEFRWYTDGPDERKNTFGFRCVLAPVGGK